MDVKSKSEQESHDALQPFNKSAASRGWNESYESYKKTSDRFEESTWIDFCLASLQRDFDATTTSIA